MKILFASDWDFTLLYKEIAKRISKELNYNCYAIINGKIFYEKYKNDGFTKCFFMQDLVGEFNKGLDERNWSEVLKDIEIYERKYGRPTLNAAAMSDRTYYYQPRIKRARRIIKTYKKIEEFIDQLSPDLVITCGFGALPFFAISDICQSKKIPIIYPLNSRVENYHLPSFTQYEESEKHGVNLDLKPNKKSITKAKLIIEEFNNHPKKPVLESLLSYDHFKFSYGHIYRFIRYIYRYYISKTYSGDHTKKPPHVKLFYEIGTRVRRKFFQKIVSYQSIPDDINHWLYFPLHIQPEYTTMICGTNCIDQIGTLISLSNSLSISQGIIVKEHPGMIGRRNMNYYQTIKDIPNVRFVNPNTSSFELIKRTKATITISGTAGMEALLLGKPVVTLGNVMYNSYKNVLSLKNTPRAKWGQEIKYYLENFDNNNEKLIDYIAKIVDQSFPFNYIEPQDNPEAVLSSENIEKFYNFIEKQIISISEDKNYGITSIVNKSYL